MLFRSLIRETMSAEKERLRLEKAAKDELERQQKIETARSNLLYESARYYADRNKMLLGDGIADVNSVYASTVSDQSDDVDTILKAIVQASQSKSVTNKLALSDEVANFLSGGVSPDETISNEPSEN